MLLVNSAPAHDAFNDGYAGVEAWIKQHQISRGTGSQTAWIQADRGPRGFGGHAQRDGRGDVQPINRAAHGGVQGEGAAGQTASGQAD